MDCNTINTTKTGYSSFYTLALVICSFLFVYAAPASAKEIEDTKSPTTSEQISEKRLVYLVSDTRIPFWAIMARGIRSTTHSLGYHLDIYSADNKAKLELEFTIKALRENVDGIIISPTTSSACVTILKLANKAGIPVVIADIGADSGDYVSYISSNNRDGAYQIGKVLTEQLIELNWNDGTVGIVAIPQKRLNGQARTAGFMQALKEAGIKGGGIKQQVTFTEEETYRLSTSLLVGNPNLRAIWLQGSDRYNGALRAIADAGKKNQVLLITFDAEPEFLTLIPQGVIAGSAIQQPFLMGQEASKALDNHLKGEAVQKQLQLPVLAISKNNIQEQLSLIKRNVLGLDTHD